MLVLLRIHLVIHNFTLLVNVLIVLAYKLTLFYHLEDLEPLLHFLELLKKVFLPQLVI